MEFGSVEGSGCGLSPVFEVFPHRSNYNILRNGFAQRRRFPFTSQATRRSAELMSSYILYIFDLSRPGIDSDLEPSRTFCDLERTNLQSIRRGYVRNERCFQRLITLALHIDVLSIFAIINGD